MSVTLDTSQFERSPLNLSAPGRASEFASTNNPLMSVTAETFQDPIGPCGPLEQSVDSWRHWPMAARSSLLDLSVGLLVVVVVVVVVVVAVVLSLYV